MRENNKSEKKGIGLAVKVIVAVLAVVCVFSGVFFLYDSPAKYVTTQNGDIYINSDGEPVLYYTDLFGKTFYQENGKRVYAAVPAHIDTRPITTEAASEAEGSAAAQ